jgi:hypothetical protein
MAERSRFLDKIIEGKAPEAEAKSFTSERQHTAQAFNLHVERRDGRQAEGFAWSHYSGYLWTDKGDRERLVVIFGTRAVEIEGYNLGALVEEIRDGQLNGIRELVTGKTMLLEQANPDNEPIIASVRTYPDFEEVLKEIKGDDDDKDRHSKRIAGR